jgi:hypothetical protein
VRFMGPALRNTAQLSPIMEIFMQTYGKAVLGGAGLAALSVLIFLPSHAMAKPLTRADIEGKKICWPDGDFKIFSPGGKVYNPKVGDGTWSIDKAGVISVKFPYGVVGVVTDAGGGTFVYTGSWINGQKISVAGALCN